ncbi:9155_t:CDS:2, partial [Ambispora gerdemannii]
ITFITIPLGASIQNRARDSRRQINGVGIGIVLAQSVEVEVKKGIVEIDDLILEARVKAAVGDVCDNFINLLDLIAYSYLDILS